MRQSLLVRQSHCLKFVVRWRSRWPWDSGARILFLSFLSPSFTHWQFHRQTTLITHLLRLRILIPLQCRRRPFILTLLTNSTLHFPCLLRPFSCLTLTKITSGSRLLFPCLLRRNHWLNRILIFLHKFNKCLTLARHHQYPTFLSTLMAIPHVL